MVAGAAESWGCEYLEREPRGPKPGPGGPACWRAGVLVVAGDGEAVQPRQVLRAGQDSPAGPVGQRGKGVKSLLCRVARPWGRHSPAVATGLGGKGDPVSPPRLLRFAGVRGSG